MSSKKIHRKTEQLISHKSSFKILKMKNGTIHNPSSSSKKNREDQIEILKRALPFLVNVEISDNVWICWFPASQWV